MEVKTQEQFVSATMTDEELETLLSQFAKEFPDKTFIRAPSPAFRYGNYCVAVQSRQLRTIGHKGGGSWDKKGPKMDEVHIEEIRAVIRRHDVFVLSGIKAVPYMSPDYFVLDTKWVVRYDAFDLNVVRYPDENTTDLDFGVYIIS